MYSASESSEVDQVSRDDDAVQTPRRAWLLAGILAMALAYLISLYTLSRSWQAAPPNKESKTSRGNRTNHPPNHAATPMTDGATPTFPSYPTLEEAPPGA